MSEKKLICRDLVAIVPARAESKGLPGKNLLSISGVPLYLRAVDQGVRTVGQVLLTTDIEEIKPIDLPANCILCRRPPRLAADQALMSDVIADLIASLDLTGKTVVLLQPTSPLRRDSDISRAIALFATHQYDMVLSVVNQDSSVLKYGTMVEDSFHGLRDSKFCFYNRQQLPPVFGPNGAVYVFNADVFLKSNGFPCGRIGAVQMPEERSIDIDNLEDLENVKRIVAENRLFIEDA